MIASLYAAYAILLLFVRGPEPFTRSGVSLLGVVAACYAAGALGGGVVGMLLPIGRYFLGALTLGVVGGCAAFFSVEIAMSGPFWRWSGQNWAEVAVLGCIVGALAAAGIWLKKHLG